MGKGFSHKTLILVMVVESIHFSQGAILPLEVLEGIRSTYHKSVSQKKILELTKGTSMTEKQRALIQRKAKKENVVVAFNPMARTAVELYILAYAEDMPCCIGRRAKGGD